MGEGVKPPRRSLDNKAGIDLYMPEDVVIGPAESVRIGLGTYFDFGKGVCGMVLLKSAANERFHLHFNPPLLSK